MKRIKRLERQILLDKPNDWTVPQMKKMDNTFNDD